MPLGHAVLSALLPTAKPRSNGVAPAPRQNPCRRTLLALVSAALIGILAGKVVQTYSGSVCVIDGHSMEPTFTPGSRVLTKPLFGPLLRGDIVLIDDGQTRAVKRVIGLPSETVEIWRGYVFIGRHLLQEPYLPKHTYTFPDQESPCRKFTLRDSEYFVLGDNREVSLDSRNYGPIIDEQILARVAAEQALRPTLAAFTLPVKGKRTIRPLLSSTR
jgi:signal peptidase I